MPTRRTVFLLAVGSLLTFSLELMGVPVGAAQEPDRVNPISSPTAPLPPEVQSRNVTKFSFIVYGHTRGRQDGTTTQYEHSLIVDSIFNILAGL